jgi:hypothetical protein
MMLHANWLLPQIPIRLALVLVWYSWYYYQRLAEAEICPKGQNTRQPRQPPGIRFLELYAFISRN